MKKNIIHLLLLLPFACYSQDSIKVKVISVSKTSTGAYYKLKDSTGIKYFTFCGCPVRAKEGDYVLIPKPKL